MPYAINITVRASESSDWRKVIPAGDNWNVVKNKYGEAQDFNEGAHGEFIFIFYQTGESGQGLAAIRFITGQNTSPPIGWTKVDVDINKGAGGEYIYLCYLRSPEATYINHFQSGFGKSEGSAFSDFTPNAVVLSQDLNKGAHGKYIYLGYYFNG